MGLVWTESSCLLQTCYWPTPCGMRGLGPGPRDTTKAVPQHSNLASLAFGIVGDTTRGCLRAISRHAPAAAGFAAFESSVVTHRNGAERGLRQFRWERAE